MGSYEAGDKHSDSYSKIKGSEVSGRGGSAHVVRCDVYKEALNGRDTDAKTDTDGQRGSKEYDFIVEKGKDSK